MTHTLLVTNPVKRYIEPKRKVYSLFEHDGQRWNRITDSSFYLNTARYVYSDRIFLAAQKGKRQDIRPV